MVVVLLHEAEHVYDIARGHMPLYDTHVWFEQGGERLCFLPGHHHDWVDFGVEYPLAALQQQTLQPKPLPTRITHTAVCSKFILSQRRIPTRGLSGRDRIETFTIACSRASCRIIR